MEEWSFKIYATNLSAMSLATNDFHSELFTMMMIMLETERIKPTCGMKIIKLRLKATLGKSHLTIHSNKFNDARKIEFVILFIDKIDNHKNHAQICYDEEEEPGK